MHSKILNFTKFLTFLQIFAQKEELSCEKVLDDSLSLKCFIHLTCNVCELHEAGDVLKLLYEVWGRKPS